MDDLRLALVTPRYWPHVGDAEWYLAGLAEALRQQGARPLVVTARWDARWPAEVNHREIPVVRLSPAPRGGWSTYRYLRELSRWLRQRVEKFDLVYVGNLRYDAYAAVSALRDRCTPVVLSPQSGGLAGDCRWQQTARFGSRVRHRCWTADALVAATRPLADELLEAGYPSERVHCIPYGARLLGRPCRRLRHEARAALGEVNHDLAARDDSPVAVYVGRLEEQFGLPELVRAWRSIIRRWPNARLWLIGDGPFRRALYEQIVDFQLHHEIFMPGSFDELQEVFQAADLFVAPSAAQGVSPALVSALAAGLPVVAVSTSDHRAIIEDGVHGLVVTSQEPRALAGGIRRLFEAPSLAAQLGQAAQHRARQRHSLGRVAEQHLDLFRQLLIAARGRTA